MDDELLQLISTAGVGEVVKVHQRLSVSVHVLAQRCDWKGF